MYESFTQIRVRYAETDQMGVVYYGIYPQYFEVGRVEAMRQLGTTYRQMEIEGTMLPVGKLEIKYIRGAKYDDLLTIRSVIKDKPDVRLIFYHEIFNEEGQLLTTGRVELVFVDSVTMRPKKAPDSFIELMRPFFED